MKYNGREYLNLAVLNALFFVIVISALIDIILFIISVKSPFFIGFVLALLFGIFIFIQTLAYPKLLVNKKVRDIDRNLMSVLDNILIQLNSGVPIYDVIVNISKENYGAISVEFRKAVDRINTGEPYISVLENMAGDNPSLYFRRTIWQIVNSLKAGSDMGMVIRELIDSLGSEQLIQIQKYGSQLNPLAMFYMLLAVVVPALAVTFINVIASFISLSASSTKLLFWSLFVLIVFFQFIFLGLVKSKRPNLLS